MPSQYQPVGPGDPLVLASGAPFGAWFAKVQEVGKRSWKSALITTGVGIAVPYALVSLISYMGGFGSLGFGFGVLSSLGTLFADFLIGILITIVVSVAACFVGAAGWAAGTWALVQEAATGQPADLGEAFRYGMRRASGMWPWTVLAATAFTIASVCLFLPGVYVAFGMSMFGFVAIFERGQNPIGRSFSMTHNGTTIGQTLGRILIPFAAYFVYQLVLGIIFGGIAFAIAIGSAGTFGYNFSLGIVMAIARLLLAPAFAVLLIALLPTYAEIRARETPLSTAQLQQELGS